MSALAIWRQLNAFFGRIRKIAHRLIRIQQPIDGVHGVMLSDLKAGVNG
jgi:hypothetical protein